MQTKTNKKNIQFKTKLTKTENRKAKQAGEQDLVQVMVHCKAQQQVTFPSKFCTAVEALGRCVKCLVVLQFLACNRNTPTVDGI